MGFLRKPELAVLALSPLSLALLSLTRDDRLSRLLTPTAPLSESIERFGTCTPFTAFLRCRGDVGDACEEDEDEDMVVDWTVKYTQCGAACPAHAQALRTGSVPGPARRSRLSQLSSRPPPSRLALVLYSPGHEVVVMNPPSVPPSCETITAHQAIALA